MKFLYISGAALLFFSQSLFATTLSGKDLERVSQTALSMASESRDKDSFKAWGATLKPQSIEVDILTQEQTHISYNCSMDLNQVNCHEQSTSEGDHHDDHSNHTTLDFIESGHLTALTKFKKTLSRRGLDFSIVQSIKAWVHEGGGHDHEDHRHHHGHGADVWTKINYRLNGAHRTLFVLCHVHGHGDNFSCHYGQRGEGEPSFEH